MSTAQMPSTHKDNVSSHDDEDPDELEEQQPIVHDAPCVTCPFSKEKEVDPQDLIKQYLSSSVVDKDKIPLPMDYLSVESVESDPRFSAPLRIVVGAATLKGQNGKKQATMFQFVTKKSKKKSENNGGDKKEMKKQQSRLTPTPTSHPTVSLNLFHWYIVPQHMCYLILTVLLSYSYSYPTVKANCQNTFTTTPFELCGRGCSL